VVKEMIDYDELSDEEIRKVIESEFFQKGVKY